MRIRKNMIIYHILPEIGENAFQEELSFELKIQGIKKLIIQTKAQITVSALGIFRLKTLKLKSFKIAKKWLKIFKNFSFAVNFLFLILLKISNKF